MVSRFSKNGSQHGDLQSSDLMAQTAQTQYYLRKERKQDVATYTILL
jgi:hypothetical protein